MLMRIQSKLQEHWAAVKASGSPLNTAEPFGHGSDGDAQTLEFAPPKSIPEGVRVERVEVEEWGTFLRIRSIRMNGSTTKNQAAFLKLREISPPTSLLIWIDATTTFGLEDIKRWFPELNELVIGGDAERIGQWLPANATTRGDFEEWLGSTRVTRAPGMAAAMYGLIALTRRARKTGHLTVNAAMLIPSDLDFADIREAVATAERLSVDA